MENKVPIKYNLQMFDPQSRIISVFSKGYESIICHNHDFIELVCIMSGTALHFTCGREIPLKSGDVLVIANGEDHTIRPTCAENDFTLINVIFAPEVFPGDYSGFSAASVYRPERAGTYFKEIFDEYTAKEPYYADAVKHLTGALIAKLMRLSYDKKNEPEVEKSKINSSYIEKASEYIRNNYQNDISLVSVAEYVGLCKGYLQKIFREDRQMTVYKALLLYRMEQSCRLLIETDLPVSEICELTGYSDLKNFYSAFKKVMHTTPRKYRQIRKGKEAAGE